MAGTRTAKSSKLKRLKNLKSSSPYSSTTSVVASKLRSRLNNRSGGDDSIGNLNEQIIGLEMVCVINNELDVADLDVSDSRARTRTTTLTADSVSMDFYQVYISIYVSYLNKLISKII